jgi:hypothetical protein
MCVLGEDELVFLGEVEIRHAFVVGAAARDSC